MVLRQEEAQMYDSFFSYEFDDTDNHLKMINMARFNPNDKSFMNSIFTPHHKHRRLVLTVQDQGHGISSED